jgi:hypothetical protein
MMPCSTSYRWIELKSTGSFVREGKQSGHHASRSRAFIHAMSGVLAARFRI